MGFPCKRVRHKTKHNNDEHTATTTVTTVLTKCDRQRPGHNLPISSNETATIETDQRISCESSSSLSSPPPSSHSSWPAAAAAAAAAAAPPPPPPPSIPSSINIKSYPRCNAETEHNTAHCSPYRQRRCRHHPRENKTETANENNEEKITKIQQQSKFSIGNKIISRFTQLISFSRDRKTSPPSSTSSSSSSSAPSSGTNTVYIAPTNNNYNQINTNSYNNDNSKGHKNSRTTIIATSQYFIRQSICLYAASGFLLALCYLAIPAAASMEVLHPIFAEGKSDKEILDHLLKNSRYDKRLLPPVDDADFCCGMDTPEKAKNISGWLPGRAQNRDTLTVNVSVLLLSLASPDESSLKYEVEFLLQQQWYDPRLRYANQSRYEYLNAIHHHEDIWLPDTYFIMHGDFKDPLIPMHFALRIYRNGTINYLMRRHLILSCQGRLNIFPFDDPLCSFALESISYELSHITYVWKNDEDTLRKSPSLTTLNAYLIQNATTICPIKASWRGNYSCLKVDLIFTRDRAFYFTTVFIPGIILVTSSFITFWLEWNAVPARVMIGVTTMLNFFTTSNGFRSTLPVVSNLTAMNVWDGVCMCFIYASLLEFVCVNYVGRKRPINNVVYRPGENPVTQRLPAVLSRIGVILASPLEIIESEFLAATASDKLHSTQLSTRSTNVSTFDSLKPNLPIEGYINAISSRNDDADDDDDDDESDPIKQLSSSFPSLLTATTVATPLAAPTESLNRRQSDIRSMSHEPNSSALIRCTTDDTKSNGNNNNNDGYSSVIYANIRNDVDASNGNAKIEMDKIQSMKPRRRRQLSHVCDVCAEGEIEQQHCGCIEIPIERIELVDEDKVMVHDGEKKRDAGVPNEIVACTNCGGESPCTHSANNGCATEACFVQVQKKERPHPIRVAKTIDVIARITFPSAYFIFLLFFFIHYNDFT